MLTRLFATASFAFLASASFAQVALNQIDTFTDLSTAFWSGGANPQVIPANGPGGASDAFLQINSTGGFGAGSHLATYNTLQWSGNYTSTGVKIVQADLKNLGATSITMRLVFIDENQGQWTTANSNVATLAPGSGWTRVRFLIVESAWVNVSSAKNWSQISSAVGRLMFRHDPGNPQAGGEAVVGTLGIDNITALDGVPVSPSSYTVDAGLNFGGTLASLMNSDNNSVIVLNDELDSTGQITVSGTTTFLNPTTLKITVESGATRNDLSEFVHARNFATSSWTSAHFRTTTISDLTFTGTIAANAAQHVSGSGEVRAKIMWIPQTDIDSGDGWTERVDVVRWSLGP